MESLYCPLCNGTSKSFYTHGQREFLQCSLCLSVFLHPKNYLTTEQEEAHYKHHNNNPEDTGYQNFVSPATNAVLRDFTPQHSGLDFGSGTGSPIVKVLQDNKYSIEQYDLFFHNNPALLQKQYDYITCTEVAEHFKKPLKEFELLNSLLLPNGKLYLMTDLFDEARDFGNWYYKNDHTHVFIYHRNALEWIREKLQFKKLTIEKRLITLEL
ncbi:methyltransferase domain-containing protein [Flavobacterium rakeshii]|uniref:Methyltransferase domain-containing protein n=1 Tax=Flavobacterium rakeshii TaxID=1038845 RepID=A0A6N8HED0_9FLAO|nr:class I SAM-dependent methyltransferase [Flavobacterium rakeshii]MUV03247.1 methyltransferase domain-containing protein [Flavobacterium rakeshii]